MIDCIFCRIVAGQQPADKIFEDSDVIVFLDIFPITRGHMLVVPKRHFDSLAETPPEVLSNLIARLQHLAPVAIRALKAQGFNVGLNNGAVAGQVVPHVHWHLIPRYEGDGLKPWTNSKALPADLAVVAKEIAEALTADKL